MEWISVEDRLPDEVSRKRNEIVIVCDINGIVDVAWLTLSKSIFLDDYMGFELTRVTHWMPLPPPPKEVHGSS